MGKRNRCRTAATSDPYELYELSVQDAAATCNFIERAFRDHRRKPPKSLREDFCGTAVNSIEWVRRGGGRTAIGVDIDARVLDRAEARAAERLPEEDRRRLRLLRGNVVTKRTAPADCLLALNFSYFCLRTRPLLRRYFRAARRHVADDGLFHLDAYGGSDAFREMEEPRKVEDFTYVWDQYRYDPISGHVVNAIHFRFRDGSRLDGAFVYYWRLWTLPELRELLLEAGFSSVSVYLERVSDETGEGTGEWYLAEKGEPIEGWVANMVAVP